MTLATPLASSASDRTAAAGRTRVAIAGATGFAGQELVRILARELKEEKPTWTPGGAKI